MKPVLLLITFWLFFISADGQVKGDLAYVGNPGNNHRQISQSLSTSGAGASIDVTYQRCNWRINPDSSVKGIKGDVLTVFETLLPNINSISLDFNNVLLVDSIRFRNAVI